jgi:ComF family protein
MAQGLVSELKELLFPGYCLICSEVGELVCKKCLKKIPIFEGRCVKCSRKNPLGIICNNCKGRYEPDLAIARFKYKSEAKKLIQNFKYEDVTDLKIIFAKELAELIKKSLDFRGYEVIPIPLSGYKKRYRGYNQAELVSREVSHALGLNLSLVLRRVAGETELIGLSRVERLKLIKNTFKLSAKPPEKVILIDDVITSGATIREATKALKKFGTKRVAAFSIAM